MKPPDPAGDHDCDVLVIGAGPSGSSCAYWLAKAGHDVVLVERKAFPREKTCGDGLTPRSVRQLQDMGLAQELAACHRYEGLRSHGFGRSLELPWPPVPGLPRYGYVVTRKDLDARFVLCRMARDMAIELKPYNVASLSLWQGFTFTERAERNLRRNAAMSSQLISEAGSSAEFPGRVIAALATDPDVMKRSGGTFIAAELAQAYGVTDLAGRHPRSLRAERGAPIWHPI